MRWAPLLALLAHAALARAEPCRRSETRVQGRSLQPLVADGTRLPVMVGECDFRPKRGDLVLVATGAVKVPIIKVVKAVEGDAIALEAAAGAFVLRVNGEPVRNSRGLAYRFSRERAAMFRVYVDGYRGRVPKDALLLLGDDPEGTIDSSRLGLVNRVDVVGLVVERG